MTCVSSAKRTLESSQTPSASAARIRARFVKLFDPGGASVAVKGRSTMSRRTVLMLLVAPSYTSPGTPGEVGWGEGSRGGLRPLVDRQLRRTLTRPLPAYRE